MKNNIISLKMGLLDNGSHSLKRGFEVWKQWHSTEDAWLLKESIIWVHHGVELLLKQLLVQNNEFLVFQDVNKAVERLGILRKKEGMEHAEVLDLFEHDDTVTSIGFKSLLDRVAITLSIEELNDGKKLRKSLEKLTRFRNKIVHYSIEINTLETASLISSILDPFLSLLSREVKNSHFNNFVIKEIRKVAQPLQEYLKYIRKEIVTSAIESTVEAFKIGKHVGIVRQVTGSGLTSTLVDYLHEISKPSLISNRKIFIVSDRVDSLKILFNLLDGNSQVHFHKSGEGSLDSIDIKYKTIILVTEQKLSNERYVFDSKCLVIGYNINSSHIGIISSFPNSTRILFSNIVRERDRDFYGDILPGYSLEEAIEDNVLKPVKLYKLQPEKVDGLDTKLVYGTDKKNIKLAEKIVEHYESTLNGKAVIVVKNLKSADILLASILQADPTYKEKIARLSYSDGHRTNQLVKQFLYKEDPLSIIVCTGKYLVGFDSPLVATVYVTCPISHQLRERLVNLVSRNRSEEVNGKIIDLIGLSWSM